MKIVFFNTRFVFNITTSLILLFIIYARYKYSLLREYYFKSNFLFIFIFNFLYEIHKYRV